MMRRDISTLEQPYSSIIKSRLEKIHNDVREYSHSDVTVVAASKFQPIAMLESAYEAGIRNFGENRGQEVRDKSEFFRSHDDIELSFIGRLQKNKVKYLMGVCSMIQSVDSPELAEYISSKYASENLNIDVLIEINSSGESAKGGIEPDDADVILRKVDSMDNLKLRGLMTLGPLTDDIRKTETSFRMMKEIYDINKSRFEHFNILSMGMTDDYVTALKYGSNMIRIGRLLFGERQ